jgi:hypothetical protein
MMKYHIPENRQDLLDIVMVTREAPSVVPAASARCRRWDATSAPIGGHAPAPLIPLMSDFLTIGNPFDARQEPYLNSTCLPICSSIILL